jgi:hypothetical protein
MCGEGSWDGKWSWHENRSLGELLQSSKNRTGPYNRVHHDDSLLLWRGVVKAALAPLLLQNSSKKEPHDES